MFPYFCDSFSFCSIDFVTLLVLLGIVPLPPAEVFHLTITTTDLAYFFPSRMTKVEQLSSFFMEYVGVWRLGGGGPVRGQAQPMDAADATTIELSKGYPDHYSAIAAGEFTTTLPSRGFVSSTYLSIGPLKAFSLLPFQDRSRFPPLLTDYDLYLIFIALSLYLLQFPHFISITSIILIYGKGLYSIPPSTSLSDTATAFPKLFFLWKGL